MKDPPDRCQHDVLPATKGEHDLIHEFDHHVNDGQTMQRLTFSYPSIPRTSRTAMTRAPSNGGPSLNAKAEHIVVGVTRTVLRHFQDESHNSGVSVEIITNWAEKNSVEATTMDRKQGHGSLF